MHYIYLGLKKAPSQTKSVFGMRFFKQGKTGGSGYLFNPSRQDPGRREKISLNFHFQTSLWCLKRFYKGY